MWLRNVAGGEKFRARSGCAPRSRERRRTRDTPPTVLPNNRGSPPIWVACSRAAEASNCRFGGCDPVARRQPGVARLPDPQGDRQDVRRRHAVGQHVVDLADHRHPTAGQPFCDVHLPERAAAVQRAGGDLTDQVVELTPAARLGYDSPSDVVVQVDLDVVQPHRVMHFPGRLDQLPSERRQGAQPLIEQFANLPEIEAARHLGDIEDADLEGVHVDPGRLKVEQQGVDAVESLHHLIAHPDLPSQYVT